MIALEELTGDVVVPFRQNQASSFHLDAELGKPPQLGLVIFFHFYVFLYRVY